MKRVFLTACAVSIIGLTVLGSDALGQRRGGNDENRNKGAKGDGDRGGQGGGGQGGGGQGGGQVRAQGNAKGNAEAGKANNTSNVRVMPDASADSKAKASADTRRDGGGRAQTGTQGKTGGTAKADGKAKGSQKAGQPDGKGSQKKDATVRTDGGARANNNNNNVNRNGNSGANNRANVANRSQFNPPNNFTIGRQQVNLAGQLYRPSYQNYAWHRGYWNNSYGWRPGYGGWGPNNGYGGNGLGFGIRFGNGYSNGFGNQLGYGGYGYGGYPMGWGNGGWGLGRLLYTSGYMSYFNPYFRSGYGNFGQGGLVYNYAQPVPVAVNAPNNTPDVADFDAAREAFRNGNYETALVDVNKAIKAESSDSVLHEFRSLVLFALHDYGQATATIHSVLAVGPGWDWATMVALYPDVDVYTTQLRALEQYAKDHRDSADGEFLLGYHYMTTGHLDAASRKFEQVVKLQPKDRVAGDLLRLAKGTQAEKENASTLVNAGEAPKPADDTVNPPETPETKGTPIAMEKLSGTWHANRDDDSKFNLELGLDNSFTWKFKQGETGDDFSGTYATEGPLLILQRKDGGALVGHVEQNGDDSFTFKMVGAPPDDAGLTFTR